MNEIENERKKIENEKMRKLAREKIHTLNYSHGNKTLDGPRD